VTGPFPDAPSRVVAGAGGVPIAVFSVGSGPPLVVVHGTTADHTAWRTVAPSLARTHTLHAIDRRGRGASGDGPSSAAEGYGLDLEYADLAAVVDAVSAGTRSPVDVVGHSYGGRCGLGAAELTRNLRRLVCYEGAPAPRGQRFERDELVAELVRLLEAGDPDAVMETFMRRVTGMDDAAIAAYRANPVWPMRVAAAPTVPRELVAARLDPPERFEGLATPVLLVAGSASPPVFREGAAVLASLLPDARLVTIEGAAHAAHHTHPEAFVDAVETFLRA
jgi:pimeloyl-ACP methyl ester carboxylesterase